VPAYLIASMFALLLVSQRRSRGESSKDRESQEGMVKKLARWTLVVGAGTTLLISVLLCLLFPRFEYPAPSGTYALGTQQIRLTDPRRLELYTDAPGDHREITLRVTYPADRSAAIREFPRDEARTDPAALLTLLLPNSVTPSWGAVPTHARVGAPIASRSFPVLIFSHGFPTGSPEQSTVLIEELASHGYVVMAINHAWQSIGYEFADGSRADLGVLRKRERTLGPPQTAQQALQEQALWTQVLDGKDMPAAKQAELIKQAAAANPRGTRFNSLTHQLISEDQRFVMDSLGGLQDHDPVLAGHLDVERIGVLGYSAGGTASQMTCVLDRRCSAGINLDGFQPLLLELPPLQAPFMQMSSRDAKYRTIPHQGAAAASYFLYVKGASHLAFSDAMLSMPVVQRLDLLGTIATQRMYSLTNGYALAFFDQHLLGRGEALRDLEASQQVDLISFSK